MCCFKNDTITTVGEVQVVVHGQQDDDKRFATIQLCIRMDGKQPRVCVLFRGKGKVSQAEKLSYDKRVHVMFQPKAWVDRPTGLSWIKENLAKHLEERETTEGEMPSTICFCDNLDSQTTDEFKNSLKAIGVYRSLLKARETEAIQAIDGGVGAVFKYLIGQQQDLWLMEDEEHLQLWEGTISASTKRILVTKWVAEAYEVLCTDYKDMIWNCFVKTGQGLTIDGHDDEKIKPLSGIAYNFGDVSSEHERCISENVLHTIVNGVVANNEPVADAGTPNAAEPDASADEAVASAADGDGDGDIPIDECADEDSGVIEIGADSEDDIKATTNHSERETEDDDSWARALEYGCLHFTRVVIVDDVRKVPMRLVGRFIMFFDTENMEWDFVKVISSLPAENTYRLKSIITDTWFYDILLQPNIKYGKDELSFLLLDCE
jgi:hypothetical protein